MSHDPTVNAGDIARLAGVGRAAVSNWRRRHDDFPKPVGGTAAQPHFALREVEAWLSRYGKSYQVSLADRAWQRLKASGDLQLGELVAAAGGFLASPGSGDHGLDPRLAAVLRELAAERGALAAYEFLCARYFEAHSRKLSVTRDDVAALMVRLAAPEGGIVLDPACGVGTLLLPLAPRDPAPGPHRVPNGVPNGGPGGVRVLGQELEATSARIAAARLALRGVEAEIVHGDALRHDAFPGPRADAVVCDPPFNERSWGYDELTGDPRWEHGLPPRGESELAWVQHCLTHVRPGGLVAILMPAAAASRRAGRRIRGNLLRAGALRAVVTLWPGGPDLWLLRRPDSGERPPSEIVIMDAEGDLSTVEPTLREGAHQVRIIDLLDDEVDVSPARHAPRAGADLGRAFADARERFLAASVDAPDLLVLDQPLDRPATTIGELVKAGLVTILQAPPRMAADGGDLPVLTADDVERGTTPSGATTAEPGLVRIQPGDVVATYATARVVSQDGAVLGPQLTLYRVDQRRVDPHFLAGFLRSAGARVPAGSSRVDARRTRLPRLSLAEQRAYGDAFRRLAVMEDSLREATALGETLIRLGHEGLADGRLQPPR
ncbi:class I SAM-dependent DNA methyltransferase [Nonomuraea sp. NPDC059194]|uniref:class I SAM-dependent DNA methyltransferase n=1 Tax=Nonomuraea sp. NPDC059194 TaxID=3346764 RepID=UPI0036B6E999